MRVRVLSLSAASLVWLAACGPGGDTNRERGAGGAGNETGMTGDTAAVTGGGNYNRGMDTGMGMGGARTGADTGMGGAGRMGGETLDAAGILTMLTIANTQEIQEARFVQNHGSTAAVKSLARKLETDHKANMQKGRTIAGQLGVRGRLPTDSAAADAAPTQLQGMTGAALDRAYVQHQLEAHRTNIDRIRNQMLPAAKDAQLKQYLQQTVTAMEGHLKQVQQVEQQLGRS
jgi:putative membrane protein